MRPPILTAAALGAAILLSAAAAGCGGSGEETAATGGRGGTGGASSDGERLSVSVGDKATLKGLHGSMKVRVLRIEDPMKSPPARGLIRERPKAGNRFVGVHVEFTNLGDKLYKDSVLNGARLVTDPQKAANPTILLSGKCRSEFGTRTRIRAGATETGCLPFQVKKKAKVSAFELALDSGFGPEKGAWAVR